MHTAEEWWKHVEGKRRVAFHMKEEREHAIEAWDACGTAVEFALKAHILRHHRLNRWPDRDERRELYTHDLYQLLRLAGLSQTDFPSSLRAEWRTVLGWSREHEYSPGRVPRKQARQMYEATFGRNGVIEWLKRL